MLSPYFAARSARTAQLMPGLAAHEEIFAGFIAGCAVRVVRRSRYVAVAVAAGLAIVSAGGALFTLFTSYVTQRARFERN